ncbi:YifB family Mg chelatase-like AAA ATPase [Candidatus Peregrinibacteria bacterium]|nr:YifB family Mg chelatase-like AAA ATPase [Candidatus Peregrinibacteria bacterium]
MSSKIYSIELSGLDGNLVEIEVDNRSGCKPAFPIVGLPDAAMQEARERVFSAVKNSKYIFPRGRVVANLAPADLRKTGARYDLAIAIGAIRLYQRIPEHHFQETIFLGELALNGRTRPISGILASVEFAKKKGFKAVIIPKENAAEAALIPDIKIVPVGSLREAVEYLADEISILPVIPKIKNEKSPIKVDMALVKGQAQAKRALEIAAAGGHNILLNGSPGSGKTLMAKAFQGILPKMSHDEVLEVTKIYSVAGLLPKSQPLISQRPFRIVHHTASAISIVGGGNVPGPGEISLAHRGVLFMDEIAEFPVQVLEVLRQPMEDQIITISRARGSITYPAQFILIAAMNPCPCGYLNAENTTKTCNCERWRIERYKKRLSGPLLDRFDMQLNIQPVPHNKLMNQEKGENSLSIQTRVELAVQIQQERFKEFSIQRNAEMDNKLINKVCDLDKKSQALLEMAIKKYDLSARSYFRMIKLARTIADLDGSKNITSAHVAEALQYRLKT